MNLKNYLEERKKNNKNFNLTKFSKEIGISRQQLYKYTRGKAYPSLKIVQKISELTSQLVTANDFYLK